MAFKLPRLKANLAVVNQRGQPLDYFLRFWNMDVAPSLETQITDLTAITAELQYQLGLIQAAQAAAESAQLAAQAAQNTADDALSTAGSGARYVQFSETDYFATATAQNVIVADSLSLAGGVSGGVLNNDNDWVGEVVLTEEQMATTVTVGSFPIRVSSTGIPVPGGGFVAGEAYFQISGIGTLSGTVTYRVQLNRSSGSEYSSPPDIEAKMNITPKAT